MKQIPFVDVSTPDFRYGSMLSPGWTPFCDYGIDYYGGTLKLVTSADVAGTARVLTAPTSSMRDGENDPIPLTGLVHAYVICQTGQCCDLGEADPQMACVTDAVAKEQCAALVGGAYYWSPDRSCNDPCGQCMGDDHAACGDGDACTVGRCVEDFCQHTPVSVSAQQCCDPACVTGSAEDYEGLGVITESTDGDQCTDDICYPASGCGVAPQCGVPDHPYSVPGTPCEVGVDPCLGGYCDGGGECLFDSNVCGACCLPDGSCRKGTTEGDCTSLGGLFKLAGSLCIGDSDQDGNDDLCVTPAGPIPTVSGWGLAVMLLLLATLGKICFARRVPFNRP